MQKGYLFDAVQCNKAVVPNLGVNYSPAVMCDALGIMRNKNHNTVLYYEQSLRNIKGN